MSESKPFQEGLFTETGPGAFLIGSQCEACGKITFPPSGICSNCFSDQNHAIHFGRFGTLFSYTTTFSPAARLTPPFSSGYVVTDEGTRVFAPLLPNEEIPFHIGQRMELEIAELWEEDGTAVTGYRYRISE